MSINEPLTEYLPQVRCAPTLKTRLERVAERSVTRNLADHIRFAVENYVDAVEGSAVDSTAMPTGDAVDRATLPSKPGEVGNDQVGGKPASVDLVSAAGR